MSNVDKHVKNIGSDLENKWRTEALWLQVQQYTGPQMLLFANNLLLFHKILCFFANSTSGDKHNPSDLYHTNTKMPMLSIIIEQMRLVDQPSTVVASEEEDWRKTQKTGMEYCSVTKNSLLFLFFSLWKGDFTVG